MQKKAKDTVRKNIREAKEKTWQNNREPRENTRKTD